MELHDIENKEDIMLIMRRFYIKLLGDESISYLFTDITHLNLEEHFPVLVDFWETILFGTAAYRNNAMQVHIDLHKKSSLTKDHFATWLRYFMEAVDELFDGSKAHEMKARAQAIASVMEHKVIH